jgi:hypothetical protein
MYKICDIKMFIEESSHRRFPKMNLIAGFAVTDDMKGDTEKFVLKFKDGCWSYAAGNGVYDEAEVYVSCRRSDLSALLMGSAEFGGMARVGVMKVDKPEYVRTLDTLLHAEQKPYTNTDY